MCGKMLLALWWSERRVYVENVLLWIKVNKTKPCSLELTSVFIFHTADISDSPLLSFPAPPTPPPRLLVMGRVGVGVGSSLHTSLPPLLSSSLGVFDSLCLLFRGLVKICRLRDSDLPSQFLAGTPRPPHWDAS